MRRIKYTKEGFEKLKRDYENLLRTRPEAVTTLKAAREMGDLSENGLYRAARANLSSIDARLRRFSFQIKLAEVVEPKGKDNVQIGSKVVVLSGRTEITYEIVGENEAEPSKRKISPHSPFGRALLWKSLGDEVEIQTPSGIKKLKIKEILV